MTMDELLSQLAEFFGRSAEGGGFASRDGMLLTVMLLLIPALSGLCLSVPLAFLRNARASWLSWPVRAYTYFLRGTPMLVQLFLIYYGLAQFAWVRSSAAWDTLRDPYYCALICFTLNTTAYTTEILAGQMRSIDWREIEAAQSLGLRTFQIGWRILLPSALRRALPAYGNEVIMLLHGTAIVSLVTLNDITGVARRLYADSYDPFQPFLLAGLLYLLLTWLITRLFAAMENRWLAFLRPRGRC